MYLLGLVLISKSAYSILFEGKKQLYGRIANKMTIGEVAAQGILRVNKAACGCFSSKKDWGENTPMRYGSRSIAGIINLRNRAKKYK